MGEGGQRVLNKQIPKELAHIMCFGGKKCAGSETSPDFSFVLQTAMAIGEGQNCERLELIVILKTYEINMNIYF